jgi:hypothetical protein
MSEQIYFNQKEVNYINDSDFLLTKRKITSKVFNLLAKVQESAIPILQQHQDIIPEEVLAISGKISKGENYRSLPYLILDCPRFFKKEDIFAIRTMFWWGNYCSITFHLSGRFLKKYKSQLINNITNLRAIGNYYICINKTPWEYHFNEDNYLLLSLLSEEEVQSLIADKKFLKISTRIDFDQMTRLDKIVFEFINKVIMLLK